MRDLSLTGHLFFLEVGGNSWFTAGDPMTHMCKGDKPAAEQHLPQFTPAPVSASSVISRSNLLGVGSGPDEIEVVTVGDVLMGMPSVGYLPSPSWLLGRDSICHFSLFCYCNFITKIIHTIRVCH